MQKRTLLHWLLTSSGLLVCMILAATVVSRGTWANAGEGTSDGKTHVRSPDSSVELLTDLDTSGSFLDWNLTAWRDKPWKLSYDLNDVGRDGQIDVSLVSIGQGPHYTLLSTADSDGDGRFDRRQICLPAADGTNGYAYEDLDLDGRLDAMVDRKSGQRSILIGSSWCPVLGQAQTSFQSSHKVLLGAEKKEVVFIEGSWKVNSGEAATQ